MTYDGARDSLLDMAQRWEDLAVAAERDYAAYASWQKRQVR
jgi:hypothetical protein